MYKIYLSPSQQAYNKYAYGDTTEQKECNKIAEVAKKYLDLCDEFEVKLAPFGQAMTESIKESNNWDSDIHIPIHTNAANGQASGTLVMVYDNSPKNIKLGECLYTSVRTCVGKTDFGVRINKELAELNSTTAIAAYLEIDFHDNPEAAEFIVNNTDSIGKAIAKGIYNYYGKDFKEETNPEIPKLYYVQVGAFINKENAEKLQQELQEKGYNVIIK